MLYLDFDNKIISGIARAGDIKKYGLFEATRRFNDKGKVAERLSVR